VKLAYCISDGNAAAALLSLLKGSTFEIDLWRLATYSIAALIIVTVRLVLLRLPAK
jgi:hypothetical protein